MVTGHAALRAPTALVAVVLLFGLLPAAPAAASARPVAAPVDQVDGEPRPPPSRLTAPAGDTPAATPGLRLPAACRPPRDDGEGRFPAPSPARRLALEEVHRLATGAGQTVAVIDTGVAAHARFGARLRGGGDYLTGGDGLDDCDGHGTAVAGLLAAAPSEDDEVLGVAPDARLVALRQSSPSAVVERAGGGTGGAGELRTLAEAVVRAVRAGAGVVNISEAVCLDPVTAAVEGALVQAALARAAEADVVVVAAAGNTGVGGCGDEPGQVSVPGWYDGVLAVGAVDGADRPADFTVPGGWVDIAAPGTELRSLAVDGGVTGIGTTGTSFAAPLVAGVAALVRERFPQLTAAQVADRIVATARRPAGGHDERVGFGVLDPTAALTATPTVLPAPSPAPAAGTPFAGTPSADTPSADTPSADTPGTDATGTDVAEGLLAGRAPVHQDPTPPPVEALALPALLLAASAAALAVRRRRAD